MGGFRRSKHYQKLLFAHNGKENTTLLAVAFLKTHKFRRNLHDFSFEKRRDFGDFFPDTCKELFCVFQRNINVGGRPDLARAVKQLGENGGKLVEIARGWQSITAAHTRCNLRGSMLWG